ncbi:hypothetical protein MKW92_038582 [Papaver armeniacum]|nr:hypothetical protein MKW92_038582 [Papaver armeniacum]
MEGKSPATLSAVVIGVLLTGLFIAQTPVEAADLLYKFLLYYVHACYTQRGSCLCNVETNIEQTYATNDFCKLGCVSSMCNKMIDFHTSAVNIKKEAERCNNACFKFCNKKSGTAVVAAK